MYFIILVLLKGGLSFQKIRFMFTSFHLYTLSSTFFHFFLFFFLPLGCIFLAYLICSCPALLFLVILSMAPFCAIFYLSIIFSLTLTPTLPSPYTHQVYSPLPTFPFTHLLTLSLFLLTTHTLPFTLYILSLFTNSLTHFPRKATLTNTLITNSSNIPPPQKKNTTISRSLQE